MIGNKEKKATGMFKRRGRSPLPWAPKQLINTYVTIGLLLGSGLILPANAPAGPVTAATAPASKSSSDSKLLPIPKPETDLEERVWTCDDAELAALEQVIVRMIQREPASAYAHYLLTHVYLRQYAADPQKLPLLEKAAQIAEQAIALAPQLEYGYLALADILDLMGKTSHALGVLNATEKQNIALSWRFHFARARLVGDTTLTSRTLQLLNRALASPASKRGIVVPYVVAILQASYSSGDVYAQYASWDRQFPHHLFKQVMAINLTERGDYQGAHKLYEGLRHSEPDLLEAAINDAVLLYRHLGDAKQAKEILHASLQNNEINADMKAVVHSHLGALSLFAKKEEKAAGHFIAALKLASQPETHSEFMIDAYRHAKLYTELSRVLKTANEELPGRADLQAALGKLMNEELADHDQAIAAYTNAIILDPERSDYYNSLGLAFYHLKHFSKALLAFEQAVALAPNDASALYNKACVLALLGDTSQALSFLQQAINLNPTLQKLALEDRDLAALRKVPAFLRITEENGLTNIRLP